MPALTHLLGTGSSTYCGIDIGLSQQHIIVTRDIEDVDCGQCRDLHKQATVSGSYAGHRFEDPRCSYRGLSQFTNFHARCAICRPEKTKPIDGVWVVLESDHRYGQMIFPGTEEGELKARRAAMDAYSDVKFVPFGVDIKEVKP